MDNNYTHVSILIDKSGSMSGSESDVIGGINKFIEQQKTVPGKLTVSLVQFDNLYEQMYGFEDIDSVKPLNDDSYIPRGSTALLDAAGRLVTETGLKLSFLPEALRPSKVMFLIYTDGYENSSKEWTKPKLDNLIKEQKEKYSWDFVFLGADITKEETGVSYGALHGLSSSASINKNKTLQAYTMLSEKFTQYRNAPTREAGSVAMDFSPEDEKALA